MDERGYDPRWHGTETGPHGTIHYTDQRSAYPPIVGDPWKAYDKPFEYTMSSPPTVEINRKLPSLIPEAIGVAVLLLVVALVVWRVWAWEHPPGMCYLLGCRWSWLWGWQYR